MQPCWYWVPEKANKTAVPLIVGLHTWSADYKKINHYVTVQKEAKRRGWAFVGPNFRGKNATPEGCGSDLAVQDIEDAVEYAKSNCKIDADRVYIIGGSGGGHMTLLMLGKKPGLFAAGSAFCPITDLARWHADSLLKHPGRGKQYAKMMEMACGGKPNERAEEYAKRSPLTWLSAAKAAKTPAYIVTGIHDGWTGSVPVGHSIRGFNALCEKGAEISEEHIAAIEANRSIPADLQTENVKDPFFDSKRRIHFRRTSGNVRVTLFEGGHGGNFPAGFDFLSRQRKGSPVDWTLPQKASSKIEQLSH
jgi:dipeptidyl aminopeptidase/acylaminoacyl peptidase